MKFFLLLGACGALLARRTRANGESIIAGGIEFFLGEIESAATFLIERERDRPDNSPGATGRKCSWFSFGPGARCTERPFTTPDGQEARPLCIDGPAPLYISCVDQLVVSGPHKCDSGCEFKKFSDDDVAGLCGAPGAPTLAAADVKAFIECEKVFPFVWSAACEEANVKIVLAAGAGQAYAKEVREEYLCERQLTEEACNNVMLDDCPPAVKKFKKCSGAGFPGVRCCVERTVCIKKNAAYGQCRSPGSVPAGWDGTVQDCFV